MAEWKANKTNVEMRHSIEADDYHIYKMVRLRGRSSVRWREWATGVDRIRYHNTDVLTLFDDGTVMLDSGGFRTVTTKERMNTYLPNGFGVWQDKGIWYVSQYLGDGVHGSAVMFFDGMILPRDYETPNWKTKKEEKRVKRAKWLIDRYMKKLAECIPLPVPESGDCWGCSFSTIADGRGYVEWPMGKDCVKGHLDEVYIHGSLITRALRWVGYQETSVQMFVQHTGLLSRAIIFRAVRRFLKSEMGLAG